MQNINNIFIKAFSKKIWHNIGEYCNKKTHPRTVTYRRYRRGHHRCKECGAKTGKIKCIQKSNSEMLQDDVFHGASLLKILQEKGKIIK